MSSLFDITVSKDRLLATITINKDALTEAEITAEQIREELQNKNIIFGIKEEELLNIVQTPTAVKYPFTIAEGTVPIAGENGYIVNKTISNEEQEEKETYNQTFNLRNVMKINSVRNGQLIAEIIPPSLGIPGINVYGNTVPAEIGKPVRLKPGKNVMFHENKVYATLDGQLTITAEAVNVFPIFEVNGDLDLKTGNIDFIGNVIIHGNVPTGYVVKAGGDIKVSGLVEGAQLIAGGSVYISGGIAGGMRGSVEAGVDIQANYLNQATCFAGKNVIVDRTILHSKVTSGGKVISRNAHIIGGEIKAGESVEAVDFGNHHYIPTVIHIGNKQNFVEKEIELKKEIKEKKDYLSKLFILSQRLKQRLETQGSLSTQENQLLKKQDVTTTALNEQIAELEKELSVLRAEQSLVARESFVKARGNIFPNTQVHFGKYSKNIQTDTSYAKLTLRNSEIISVPL